MLQNISNWIESNLYLGVTVQTKIISSLVIIIFLWIIRIIIQKAVIAKLEDVRLRYRWRKYSGYITVFLGVILVGRIWFQGIQSLATFFGLLSAGIAIALKDIVASFAGWAFILWRRPFEVGDRIQIGKYSGDVIDLRIFQFTLMEIGNWVDADQSTGRIIHIPNGKIFTETLANYSKGFQYIWNEIPVMVTFESNWEKAKEILQRISDTHSAHLSELAEQRIRKAAKKFMIFYSKLTPIVYTTVSESGVLLTVRYLCEPRRRRSSEANIWEDILKEFHDHTDIEFAYPTIRRFNNLLEGKDLSKYKRSRDSEDKDLQG